MCGLASSAPRSRALAWKLLQEQDRPAGELNRLPDGSVELAAPARSGRARASGLTLPPGLYEYIFEVEDAQPGTGLYFAAPIGASWSPWISSPTR